MYILITAYEEDNRILDYLSANGWLRGAQTADRPVVSMYFTLRDLEVDDLARVFQTCDKGLELVVLQGLTKVNPELKLSDDRRSATFWLRGIKYNIAYAEVARSFGYSAPVDNIPLGVPMSEHLIHTLSLTQKLDLVGSIISDATYMDLKEYIDTGHMSPIFENRPAGFLNHMVNDVYGVGSFTALLTNYATTRLQTAEAINKFYTV